MTELQSLIGREVTYTAPEEVGAASIRLFAMAIGVTPSQAAPPTFVCETNQYMSGPPNSDGYIGHMWDLPIEGEMLRGGNEYEFFQPAVPSDRLTVVWRLADIHAKGDLTFVISEATYANQHGDLLARNKETIIFRR